MFYISPGILEGALRAPWGRLEGALGLSQDNRAAPFDHRKVPVRFSVDNGIQNRAETIRLPSGSHTVHLRALYGLLRVVYGMSAVIRSHENAGKIGSSLLSTTAPARLVKIPRGPWESSGTIWAPHGNGKITVFTRHTGPLMDMRQSHYGCVHMIDHDNDGWVNDGCVHMINHDNGGWMISPGGLSRIYTLRWHVTSRHVDMSRVVVMLTVSINSSNWNKVLHMKGTNHYISWWGSFPPWMKHNDRSYENMSAVSQGALSLIYSSWCVYNVPCGTSRRHRNL